MSKQDVKALAKRMYVYIYIHIMLLLIYFDILFLYIMGESEDLRIMRVGFPR